DVQTTYWRGMQMQESLQLTTIEMQVNGTLVRRYEFGYEQSAATKRTFLQSVQECTGTECFAPTRFHYGKSETGFEPYHAIDTMRRNRFGAIEFTLWQEWSFVNEIQGECSGGNRCES
ncbi:MAG TPA: hypothetical protein PK156_49370, partial [Polyangium sp.]|nr:hypothetical protein [Polyangium sp.]